MTALAKYNEFQATLTATEDGANFLPDVTTKEGYEKSKRIALDGRKVWNAIDTARKTLGTDARKLVDDINTEGKKHLARVDAAINPHLKAYKEHDATKKKEEEEFEQRITDRINAFQVPFDAHTMSSEQLAIVIDGFANDQLENFYSRTTEAGKARSSVVDQLTQIRSAKIIQEEEAKQFAAQQAELAEQQEKARKAQSIIDEANRIEADKLAAQAEDERQARQKVEEEQRIKEALRQAEIDKKQAAIDARKREEEAAAAAVKAERERTEAAAAAEAAEVAKLEANKRHVGAIRKAAKTDLIEILGVEEKLAVSIVMAITKGLISNVTISYKG